MLTQRRALLPTVRRNIDSDWRSIERQRLCHRDVIDNGRVLANAAVVAGTTSVLFWYNFTGGCLEPTARIAVVQSNATLAE